MATARKAAPPTQFEPLDVSKFKPDLATFNKFSTPRRVAFYLDWASVKYPKQFTQYNQIWKAISGQQRMPRMDSSEVLGIRHALTRIRQILIEKYGRQCVAKPGLGIRATVDSTDIAAASMTQEVIKVRRAQASAAKTYALIDQSTIADKMLKEWLNRDVKEVMKTLNAPEFQAKLQLPAAMVPSNKEKK